MINYDLAIYGTVFGSLYIAYRMVSGYLYVLLSRALVGKSIVKSIIFKSKETNVNNKIFLSFKGREKIKITYISKNYVKDSLF